MKASPPQSKAKVNYYSLVNLTMVPLTAGVSLSSPDKGCQGDFSFVVWPSREKRFFTLKLFQKLLPTWAVNKKKNICPSAEKLPENPVTALQPEFQSSWLFVLKIKIPLLTFSTGNWNSSVKGTEMTLMLFMSATTCKKRATLSV